MTTYWSLCNWRNKTIFEVDFKPPHNPVAVIKNFTKEIDGCTSKSLHYNLERKNTIYVGWRNPPTDWLKLNSDDAC